MSPDFSSLAHRFCSPGVRAVVLMGSYAREDAGIFSDIDIVRFVDEGADPDNLDGSHVLDDHLVVVSSVPREEVLSWFSRPEKAVVFIDGLRTGKVLIDEIGYFAALQQRANEFHWDQSLQRKANLWIGRQLVGWIEEVHKGLEGLRRSHIGRLLNARFGLSWGVARVMCVANGVLLSGDNDFFDQVLLAVGPDTRWSQLMKVAFGLDREDGTTPSLRQQVVSGLQLYLETSDLLLGRIGQPERSLIEVTAGRIRSTFEAEWFPTSWG